MTYWVEVHCDVKSEATAPGRYGPVGCYTTSGECPGGGAVTLAGAGAAAKREALEAGWKHRQIAQPRYGQPRKGWACPHCLRNPQPEAHA